MSVQIAKPSQLLQAPKAVPEKWRVCMILAALAVGATYWPHALDLLRLEGTSALSGQIWRLLSGHLVHLNTPHLMMNLLALFLLCELLWRDLDWRHGVGLLLFAALAISGALLAWHPEIAWYAGLSGVLHGLWAGCALHGLGAAAPSTPVAGFMAHFHPARWPAPRRICAIALALLCLKLTIEYCFGPSQRTEQVIGGAVIAVSHAYGALAGAFYLAAWRMTAMLKPAALLRFRLK